MAVSTVLLVLNLALNPAPSPASGAGTCAAEPATSGVGAPADSALVALYAGGETFERFLARADARRAMWRRHWAEGRVPADALATARALGGRWRLLVIAVDACSDSVNTIPFIALLVAAVPGLEMRVIAPDAAGALLESRRTPDGRTATPTVIFLDADGRDAGCWIERPSALQALAQEARAAGTIERFARGKQAWYDADAGASTVREIVELLVAAASGAPRCGSPPATTPGAPID
ncbi:MAG: thioredoxin family protein [Gemmatimonadaceae bacterium]